MATFHSPGAVALILFGLLAACVAVTVELTRQEGEKNGLVKDVYSAWALPAAILLPPLYVLVLTALCTTPSSSGASGETASTGAGTAQRSSAWPSRRRG